MGRAVRLRWTPLAVDTLIDLEDYGQPEVARRIITAVTDRLTKQPEIYREVEIPDLKGRRRHRMNARRLYLGRRLPYLVYYHYDRAEGVVEIVRILHARQRPIERG